ncbi:MAG: aminotransferase class V-fold PLP-dependent enzyme [Bacteroidetes bacterium]|nr:aminotransferase class V-fold PLP-dependent enzyme [Bacteroidota bacterium]MBS1629815.1 aminotransferase class V-fold PLP-dependent enzyme [Bacteroidota bacterium]
MPLSRRYFIRASALLSACTLQELSALAAPLPIPPPGDSTQDEHYWVAIRNQFPLSRDWAYLNNGTLGPSPQSVIKATQEGMMDTERYGHYDGYLDALKSLAGFLGADAEEIALTHNVTEGINIACWGLPLHAGDEVILSTQEHVGNAFPWLNRRKLHGIVLKAVDPAPTATETLSRIEKMIGPKTRAIAVPHIPCTQGQVLPIRAICQLARERGLFSTIDGAHGPGMMPIDLHDMGCDTYASCCHKWMLGPKGTGFLYVRRDFQEILQPYFVGGGGDTGEWNMATIPIKDTHYAAGAHRYFGGTQSLGLAKGILAAVDFLQGIGMKRVQQRVHYLGAYTQAQLQALGERIELLTPTEPESYCGVNGFRIRGVERMDFFNQCMAAQVRIRAVAEDGLDSLRVSTHIYNTPADVDRLIAEIRKRLK